jgi:hypothetical protein
VCRRTRNIGVCTPPLPAAEGARTKKERRSWLDVRAQWQRWYVPVSRSRSYAVSKGQYASEALSYAKLPAPVQQRATELLAQLTVDGQPLKMTRERCRLVKV